MNIGEVSQRSGLPAKTIRYYEDIGLVEPLRSSNGYRAFRESDLHKLAFLGRARSLGFTIGFFIGGISLKSVAISERFLKFAWEMFCAVLGVAGRGGALEVEADTDDGGVLGSAGRGGRDVRGGAVDVDACTSGSCGAC